MERLRCFLSSILLFVSLVAVGQDFDATYSLRSSGDPLKDKLFYLFTLVSSNDLQDRLINDELQTSLFEQKKSALENLAQGKKHLENLRRLRFTDDETLLIAESVSHSATESSLIWQLFKGHIIPSGYFHKTVSEKQEQELVIETVIASLRGINRIIDMYGLGIHGKYADIDSVSFDVRSAEYGDILAQKAGEILSTLTSKKAGFFEPSLQIALALLHVNERTDAGRFEPMETGVNEAAFKKVKKVNWSAYPYSVILVPGNGPKGTERLSENAKKRLKSAVDNYNRKLAPFIMISGGSVHPYKTKINEAEEMKKELMGRYGIPESDIIMEPHARHTTTNLRNCNRLVLRYGFPMGKKVLITTDKKQADKINHSGFVARCEEELGHVPFVRLNKISDIDIGYYPVLPSLQIDLNDPLDP